MSIHQFNLQYNPEQDRIMFRVSTVKREEFRFYLTRRYVKVLWPVLQKVLDTEFKKREPEKAHVASDMVRFEHENIVSRADFKQQYDDRMETHPLGEDYILLARIQVKQGPVNMLCLHPAKGMGIEFHASNMFLHAFCKLLVDTVRKADWDMEHLFGGAQPAVAMNVPKTLH